MAMHPLLQNRTRREGSNLVSYLFDLGHKTDSPQHTHGRRRLRMHLTSNLNRKETFQTTIKIFHMNGIFTYLATRKGFRRYIGIDAPLCSSCRKPVYATTGSSRDKTHQS